MLKTFRHVFGIVAMTIMLAYFLTPATNSPCAAFHGSTAAQIYSFSMGIVLFAMSWTVGSWVFFGQRAWQSSALAVLILFGVSVIGSYVFADLAAVMHAAGQCPQTLSPHNSIANVVALMMIALPIVDLLLFPWPIFNRKAA